MPARRSRRDDGLGGFDERDVESLLSAFARMDPRVRAVVLIALAVVGGVLLVNYCRRARQQQAATTAAAAPGGSVQLLLGNPSGATAAWTDRNNYLMVKPYFALSYNSSAGEPNWVSWQVTSADLGNAPRKPVFDSDGTLPAGFTVITQQDYNGSGFDRGHMCPHSDRAANETMAFATFVMTNIIPQAPNVNQKAWAQLEMYGRELARNGNHLYIIAGPLGRGGRGSKGRAETIARGTVIVPAECWKVIVVVPEGSAGGDDLGAINASTRVIAVEMPNDNLKVGQAWAGFRTSPAAIEQRTGFHFFTNLRPEVADALRAKVDDQRIPAPRPMNYGN